MSYRNIKTLKGKVEDILAFLPDARNSDITLTIALWRKYYPHLLFSRNDATDSVELTKLFDLPREDFIGRVRRKFQESGKYLPTHEHIAKLRGLNMDEWRVAMGYPTKETSGTPKPSWTPPSLREQIDVCSAAGCNKPHAPNDHLCVEHRQQLSQKTLL